jgi:cytochrome c biogenesis protein CcmG/thiol:disulfide interchange protein DsbE
VSSGVKWPILAGGLLGTGTLVALLYSGFGTDPMQHEDVMIGKPAATWKLVDLQGQEWSLEALRGKPVVLNFWSSWCLPCKQEHPLLVQAPKLYPDVTFLGIIYSDEPKAIERYIRQHGSGFSHLVDPGGRTAIDYGVGGVPETLFIDKQGTITYKQIGPLDPRTLEALIARIR